MKYETANCALCGVADSDLVFSAPTLRLKATNLRFDLRRCKRCALVFLSPRPTESEMAVLYQPNFYNSPHQKIVRLVDGMILRERVSFVRQRLAASKLLDVGCGDGGFFSAMARNGFDAYGIDPYQAALANIAEALKARITCAPFETAVYPKESFDVITLWHVLEHLSRPVETLQGLGVFLKPDGRLILEVPNFDSPEARWLGPNWYNLDAPYHFWHFTPKTLQAVVEAAGFQVLECVTSSVTRPVWLLNYLLLGANAAGDWWQNRHPTWRKHPQLTKVLALLLCFGSRVIFAHTCPMLRLVCRKAK